jgi:tripartite-type tricarboxylate transporter receptor subunit TctC
MVMIGRPCRAPWIFPLLFALAAAPAPGVAQVTSPPAFPSKPVRLVVGLSAGAQTDTIARLLGQKLSERWGQPVVVDNRTGAGGVLAASTVAKATPDGHTLLLLTSFAISAALSQNLPYDPIKDFAGVTQIGFTTQALAAAPALGIKSVKELIGLAQAQPGKLLYASGAAGLASHLNGEKFRFAAGIKVVNVAFKGGSDVVIETLAGRTQYCFAGLAPVLPFIKDGRLLALAVNTPQRSPALPDVPTLGETLAEFKKPESSSAMLAPAKTPRPILNQISKDIALVINLPDVRERLQAIGLTPAPSTPAEYDVILREQITALSKLVRDAGLRAR